MSDTPETAAIRERRAKITPGPWFWSRTYEYGDGERHWCLNNPASELTGQCIDGFLVLETTRRMSFDGTTPLEQTPNFVFIAHAPSDMEHLLAQVSSLTEARDEARARNFRLGTMVTNASRLRDEADAHRNRLEADLLAEIASNQEKRDALKRAHDEYVASSRAALSEAEERIKALEAESDDGLLSYLDDCGSGVDVHFIHSADHDGKRDEMREDGLYIWVNQPIGDPDRSGYIEGENISDALRDSLANQPSRSRPNV